MSKGIIVVAVDDMFFAAKIRGCAEALSAPVHFARNEEDVKRVAREENPSLIVFDLHSRRFDSFQLARELKGEEQCRHIRLLGFFSHVQTELERKARAAGFDQVMPRSAFSKRLAEILRGEKIQ